LAHVAEFEVWKASKNREGGGGDPSKVHGVKCMSILFKLPYWKVSLIVCSYTFYISSDA